MEERSATTLRIPADVDPAAITGPSDALLRLVQDSFDSTSIALRGDTVRIEGTAAETAMAATLFDELIRNARSGEPLDSDQVRRTIQMLHASDMSPRELREDVLHTSHGRAVRPKTQGQKRYVDAIRTHRITFGLGPAGTGKTYLAMALAVAALERREVGRIVLTRPIVEAGENLGFLPGTLTEKVDPYIRPLYDALFDMMNAERATALIEANVIEIAPLAFMRGRTLSDAFVILDEAQNTTREQMKMFLTRLGHGSKMVVTGDMSQTDLVVGAVGLAEAETVLSDISQIAFCRLSGNDVVRDSLVAEIVEAYDRAEGEM